MYYKKLSFALLIYVVVWLLMSGGYYPVAHAAPPLQAEDCDARAQQAEELIGEDAYQEALTQYQTAYECYVETNNDLQAGYASYRMGQLLQQLGDRDAALEIFEQAESHYAEAGEQDMVLADVLTRKGDIYYYKAVFFDNNNQSEQAAPFYQNALDNYRRALVISREEVNWDHGALLYKSIGDVHFNQERYADAMVNYRQALAMYQELDNSRGESGVLSKMAHTHLEQEKYDAAIANYNEALRLNREQQSDAENENISTLRLVEADILKQLGQAYLSKDTPQITLGRTQLESALRILQELKSSGAFADLSDIKDDQAYTTYYLALSYQLEDNDDQASKLIDAARAIYTDIDTGLSRYNQAILLEDLGDIQRAQGHFDEARTSYEEAIDLWRVSGQSFRIIGIKTKIGDTYVDQGEYVTAQLTYILALKEDENAWLSLPLQLGLGRLYELSGDYEQALLLYKYAVGTYQKISNDTGHVRSLNALGRVQYLNGEYAEAETALLALLDESAGRNLIEENRARITLAQLYETIGRDSEANAILDNALASIEGMPDTVDKRRLEVDALTTKAHFEQAAYEYTEAAEALEQADATLTSDAEPQAATLLISRAELEAAQEEYTNALELYKQALTIVTPLNEVPRQIDIYLAIGDVHLAQGNSSDAGDAYNTASELYASIVGENQMGRADLLNRVGRALEANSEYAAARKQYEEALTASEATGNRLLQGDALLNLARLARIEGRLDRAIGLYRQAEQIFSGINAQERLIDTYLEQGRVYQAQGRFEDAAERYGRAEGAARNINSQAGKARVFIQRARLHAINHEFEKAEDDVTQALNIGDTLGNRGLQVEALLAYGNLFQDQDKRKEALAQYQAAYEVSEELGDRTRQAESVYQIGQINLLEEDYATAGKNFKEALDIYEQTPDAIARASAYFGLAQAQDQDDQGDDADAVTNYLEAIRLLENARLSVGDEQSRARFIAGFAELYTKTAAILFRNERYKEALFVAEQGRARSLLDTLVAGQLQLGSTQLETLWDAEQETFEALQTAQQELSEQQAALLSDRRQGVIETVISGDIETELDQLQANVDQAQAAHQNVLDKIENVRATSDESISNLQAELASLHFTDEADFTEKANMLVSDAGIALDNNSALLSYFVLKNTILAFLITTDGKVQAAEIDISRADLETDIDDLIADIAQQDETVKETLQTYYTALIGDTFGDLSDTAQLIIVPHADLNYLPFAALVEEDGDYLVQTHTVATVPSITAFLEFNKKRDIDFDVNNASLLLMGRKEFSQEEQDRVGKELKELPNAIDEIKLINRLFDEKATVFIEDEATEVAFRQEASQASIIHISSHAIYDDNNPLHSTIYLVGENDTEDTDGKLEVQEIAQLDLSQSELVVLSACQTSEGTLTAGDELTGLNRAFFQAQARTVVASLWQVEEGTTTILMGEFYKALADGKSKAEALALAQRKLIKQTSDQPFFWAAFVLSGDSGPVSDELAPFLLEVRDDDTAAAIESTIPHVNTRRATSIGWGWIMLATVLVMIGGAAGGTYWQAQRTKTSFPEAAQQLSQLAAVQLAAGYATVKTQSRPLLVKTQEWLSSLPEKTAPLRARGKAAIASTPELVNRAKALPPMTYYIAGGVVGVVLLIFVGSMFIGTGEGGDTPDDRGGAFIPQAAPSEPTEEPADAPTQEPTDTPEPTATPTSLPPTETPTPPPTDTPKPTETPTPEPTDTPEPTETPIPPGPRQLILWSPPPAAMGQVTPRAPQWLFFNSGKATEGIILAFVRNAENVEINVYDGNTMPAGPPADPNQLPHELGRGTQAGNRDRNDSTAEFTWKGGIQPDTRYWVRILNNGNNTISYCIQTRDDWDTCP